MSYLTTYARASRSDGVSDQHSYGRDEWQAHQLTGLSVEQLQAEHAGTSLDEYRAKVEAEFKRRRIPVPDAPAPKRKRRTRK